MTFVGDDGVDGGGHCRDGSFRTCSGGGPTGVLGGGTPIDGAGVVGRAFDRDTFKGGHLLRDNEDAAPSTHVAEARG